MPPLRLADTSEIHDPRVPVLALQRLCVGHRVVWMRHGGRLVHDRAVGPRAGGRWSSRLDLWISNPAPRRRTIVGPADGEGNG